MSAAPWDTLNFALNVGDDPVAVHENFARAARSLGVDRIYIVSQIHGTAAQVLTGVEDPADVRVRPGDIVISKTPGVACGVRSADCVPVLVGDRRSGAAAAIHSGWRGTVANAAAAGVAALRSLIGGPGDLVAAVGPHIEACCFEVGEDVAKQLAGCSSLGEDAVRPGAGGKPHVNLRGIVRAQLRAAGVDAEAIEDVPGCTAHDVEWFHSFRRDGQRSGRLLSTIVAR